MFDVDTNLTFWIRDRNLSDELVDHLVGLERERERLKRALSCETEVTGMVNDQRDLLARRSQIAQAILRDDEHGLDSTVLELIARHIWCESRTPDPTQIPTGSAPIYERVPTDAHDREPDFYVTPTWGEKEGWALVGRAQGLLNAIEAGLPVDFNWGDLKSAVDGWRAWAARFCSKFGSEP